jgi:rsbT antagonist protein RsbS
MGFRVPIIHLHGNLIVVVQGELTDAQTEMLREDIGQAVQTRGARGLVIDLSGVEVLDSYLTRAVHDCAVAARLMGVPTALSGIRPSVAITLVEMGLDVPGAVKAMNLEHALERLTALSEDEAHEDGPGPGTAAVGEGP